ncbi:MAG TPA: hypothetical protein VGK20_11900 [Candidatus Binatia bacterium]|jgi:hypothetical protein
MRKIALAMMVASSLLVASAALAQNSGLQPGLHGMDSGLNDSSIQADTNLDRRFGRPGLNDNGVGGLGSMQGTGLGSYGAGSIGQPGPGGLGSMRGTNIGVQPVRPR